MSLLLKNLIFLDGKKRDIFIKGNKIFKIGPKLNFKADERLDAKGEKLVLPGFVNAHTHSPMIILRGIGEGLPLNKWLKEKIWPIEEKLSENDIYLATKLAILEMIKSGTVCFNEMYWYEEAIISAVKEMGTKAMVGIVILEKNPLGRPEKVVPLFKKLKREIKEKIRLAIAPHSIYTVSEKTLIWARDFARSFNLPLHLHVAESEKEINFSLKKFKLRPIEFLEKIGLLNERTILAHSIWVDEKEIKILAKRKTALVYCPSSNMKLASGIFPYKKMKKEKINILLGTDGPASNNSLDLIKEMKIASLLAKISEKDPSLLFPKEVFQMITTAPAKVFNFNFGSVKEGKLADLVLIDLSKINLFPRFDLLSNLIYSADQSAVSDLICDGVILMKNRKIEKEEKIKREGKILERKLKKILKKLK